MADELAALEAEARRERGEAEPVVQVPEVSRSAEHASVRCRAQSISSIADQAARRADDRAGATAAARACARGGRAGGARRHCGIDIEGRQCTQSPALLCSSGRRARVIAMLLLRMAAQ